MQASLLARFGPGTKPDTVAAWAGAVRVQALLATRLRLAPQARIDAKTVGIRQRNAAEGYSAPPPWARERGDDE